MVECGISSEVFKQYLTGFFVLITDDPEPQQETPKFVFVVIVVFGSVGTTRFTFPARSQSLLTNSV